VAVRKHVGCDAHPIADRSLDREASSVDLRPDVLDDDAIGDRLTPLGLLQASVGCPGAAR
jgi:hypothetical protein